MTHNQRTAKYILSQLGGRSFQHTSLETVMPTKVVDHE